MRMPGALQVLGNPLLRAGMQRHMAEFLALAVNPQMLDATALV
jgi:hypothetical protein